jgi:cytochrome c
MITQLQTTHMAVTGYRRIWILCVLGCLTILLAACQGDEPASVVVDGGDPDRGEELVMAYECGSCHFIPGIDESRGQDAPGLQLWANRSFVAGAAPNEPENVMHFLMDPQSIQPGSGMPDLGISEEEARHITAFLFTVGPPD